ncbi:MAG: metallopeptidase family protein [Candidatus Saccharimonadales bacterium]
MVQVSDEQFDELMHQAIDSLPKEHIDHLKNVAILFEDDPDEEQRVKVHLQDDQTLFGLYEGIPLARRQGMQTTLPDKITLFKNPLQMASYDLPDLKEHIRHTLWHEIAHYYGLNHDQIGKLE